MSDFVHYSPLVALAGFFLGFVLIIYMTFRPSKKAEIESRSLIPLREDAHE